MTRYLAVIERGETSWGAHVPDLLGCIAVAESRADVVSLIRGAISLHVEQLKSDGLPLPEPVSEWALVEIED